MTIEKSHGKARPTLPRSSDLGSMPPTERVRDTGRGPDGRFQAGNGAARGKTAKRAVAAIIGKASDDPVVTKIVSNTRASFKAKLAELPHDGAIVSRMVAMASHHESMFAFWSEEAFRHGLTTDDGLAASSEAMKHGQRAERIMVTALDAAKALAVSRKSEPGDVLDAFMPSSSPNPGSPPRN